MKALVTGANGFTGSHVSRYLLARGWDVRAIVRPSSDLSAVEGLPLEWFYADLTDPAPLDDAVRGVDVVFHIAALYRTEGVPRHLFHAVNVEGTRRLLEASVRAGRPHFVHCSTVGVQGDIRRPPATEEAPYAPGDHYQRSKAEGEILALRYFRSGQLPGCVVRPTGVYGPGDTRFLKLFRFIQDGRFRMIGSGEVLYHLTYVEDLAAGLFLAGTTEKVLGEVITIGGAEHVTLNELVALIAKTLGRRLPNRRPIPVWPVWTLGLLCELTCLPLGLSPPLYRRRVEFFAKNRAFDISKARRLLGYAPCIRLDEGLRRTAAWYRDRGLLR